MKIVVLDRSCLTADYLDWSRLNELGEVSIYDKTPRDKVVERIRDAQIVLTNNALMNEEVFSKCPELKYIGVFSTGYNHINLEDAKKYGITVCNAPSYGTKIVAQNAVALLLEVTNRIAKFNSDVRNGHWVESSFACAESDPIIELDNKTAGIIGFGRIGRQSARILSAIGMNIIYYDVFEAETEYESQKVEFKELLERSDVIFLHCPLNEENREIINKETISRMKDGVILVNNARGGLINDNDLAEALKNGKIRAAALDVVSKEPISKDNPLLECDNCIITPHISWSSNEARIRMIETAIDNVKNFIEGHPVNTVN